MDKDGWKQQESVGSNVKLLLMVKNDKINYFHYRRKFNTQFFCFFFNFVYGILNHTVKYV